VGAGNYKLAGQYVQICALLFTLLYIPNILVWSFLVDDVIILFGFNEDTARIGQEFAIVVLFHEWLVGLSIAFHGLLNVIGYEKFATFIGVVEGIVSVCSVAALVVTRDETTLQEVGLVNLAIGVVFFLFTVWYTICKGWINDYLEGMVGSFAFFVSTLSKQMLFVDSLVETRSNSSLLLASEQQSNREERCKDGRATCIWLSPRIRRVGGSNYLRRILGSSRSCCVGHSRFSVGNF
jgi:hypothetical protein